MNILSQISIIVLTSVAATTALANPEQLIHEAFRQYQSDFQTEEGKPVTDEVLGFEWQRQGEEAWIQIFEVKATGQLGSELYDCHADGGPAECNYLESKTPINYLADARKYSIPKMQTAAREAFKLIASKVDLAADISALKLWQSGKLMQVKVTSKSAISYLNCHQHGADIDCHRQPKAGAKEPGF